MNGYQQQLDMSWVVFELEAVCDSTMPCDSAHAMHRTAQQQHDHVVLPLEWTGASVAWMDPSNVFVSGFLCR